ncbi:MAG: type II secretion system F family protein [Elusimicrobia bacterium]|nr:type II secretion system F family protein [Elusimicrobiota bacterium]
MARFSYTVQDAQGNVSTGALEAEDEDSAVNSLQTKGYFILSIQSESSKSKGLSALKQSSGGKVSGRELVFFGEQISTLIAGGVPLVKALTLLSEHAENKALASVLTQITKEVSAGGAFHKALEKHPKVFDEIWISLVQAGEVSGQLPAVLRQITAYTQMQEEVKGKIITAVSYPAVLSLMSMGVLFYFVIFIVPTFADIFRDFKLELPIITKLVIAFSNILRNYSVVMVVALIGAFFAFKAYILTPGGKLNWNKFLFSLPFLGNFVKNIQMERMLSTMSTLIKSGVSILNAISVLEGAFKNSPLIQNALKKAKGDISSGKSIAESFKKTGMFPGMVTDMMWMGEESGKLPDIIDVLSKFYQEQIDQFLRRFSAMIDPILMVGIGGVIGVIVMSVFMPIFQLSQIKG